MSIDLSLANVPRSSTGLIMPKGVIFYYLYDCTDGHRPIGCVCFGPGKTRFCRGIALCSARDNFSRAVARELSYRRYLLAAHGRKSTGRLGRPWVCAEIGAHRINEPFKSAYRVVPTEREAGLWDKSKITRKR